MIITNVIVHKIISAQYDSEVIIQKRGNEITLPNNNADNLLSSIELSINKDRNIAFAGFDEISWFPQNLNNYINDNSSFYEFSVDSLSQLASHMSLVPAATGGYLVMAHYSESNGNPFFMVILLKDREGIGINDKLDLEPIQSLDLERLHFAARIDISKWQSTNPKIKRNHIWFLKGKNRENVVKYFKTFLGINEGLYSDPQKQNANLVKAVLRFTSDEYDYAQREIAIHRIHELAIAKNETNEYISLQEITSLISPNEPDKFITYLIQEKIEIPGEFPVEISEINKLNRLRARTKDFYISFHRDAIENGIIWKNDRGNIEIKGAPQELLNEFPS